MVSDVQVPIEEPAPFVACSDTPPLRRTTNFARGPSSVTFSIPRPAASTSHTLRGFGRGRGGPGGPHIPSFPDHRAPSRRSPRYADDGEDATQSLYPEENSMVACITVITASQGTIHSAEAPYYVHAVSTALGSTTAAILDAAAQFHCYPIDELEDSLLSLPRNGHQLIRSEPLPASAGFRHASGCKIVAIYRLHFYNSTPAHAFNIDMYLPSPLQPVATLVPMLYASILASLKMALRVKVASPILTVLLQVLLSPP